MKWPEVRNAHPDQWVVIEALEAHTTPDRQRVLDRLAVVDTCHRRGGIPGLSALAPAIPAARVLFFAYKP